MLMTLSAQLLSNTSSATVLKGAASGDDGAAAAAAAADMNAAIQLLLQAAGAAAAEKMRRAWLPCGTQQSSATEVTHPIQSKLHLLSAQPGEEGFPMVIVIFFLASAHRCPSSPTTLLGDLSCSCLALGFLLSFELTPPAGGVAPSLLLQQAASLPA